MSKQAFYNIVYKTVRLLSMPYVRRKFNYYWEKAAPVSYPYLVLSNHVSGWDPFFVVFSFPRQMYYFVGEHVLRWGLAGKLINFLTAPIAYPKTAGDLKAVQKVLAATRSGKNICIFAEGNMSNSGESTVLSPAIGKLVRRSGAGLITYRIHGAYLSNPRWGRSVRKGKAWGAPVRYFSPEELAAMDAAQINAIIQEDLYVNAYAEQEQEPIAYKGKDLAENLELILYLCPRCHRISTLSSAGDFLSCSCGLSLRYTPWGYLESEGGEAPPFKTVLEWDRWQREYFAAHLEEYLALPEGEALFSDPERTLIFVGPERNTPVGRGSFTLYKDRLAFQEPGKPPLDFPFSEILDMQTRNRNTLIFSTTDRRSYEAFSDSALSAQKYLTLYQLLSQPAAGRA